MANTDVQLNEIRRAPILPRKIFTGKKLPNIIANNFSDISTLLMRIDGDSFLSSASI
jgi:hypothetical protein